MRQSEKIYEIEFWQKFRKKGQAHFKSTGPCVEFKTVLKTPQSIPNSACIGTMN
jgi:hypothetical protein